MKLHHSFDAALYIMSDNTTPKVPLEESEPVVIRPETLERAKSDIFAYRCFECNVVGWYIRGDRYQCKKCGSRELCKPPIKGKSVVMVVH